MRVLLPEPPIGRELLGDHRVDVDVLRDVVVVFGRVVEGGGTVGGDPDGWMGRLIGPRGRHRFVELPVLARIRQRVRRPRLNDDVERLGAHLVPALEGEVPPDELVHQHAGARAELDPPLESWSSVARSWASRTGWWKGSW